MQNHISLKGGPAQTSDARRVRRRRPFVAIPGFNDTLMQQRLETHASVPADKLPPVAGLRGRREIAVAKCLHSVLRDARRLLRAGAEMGELRVQVGEILLHSEEVLPRARGDHEAVERLQPFQVVGDDDGVAILDVFQPAGV